LRKREGVWFPQKADRGGMAIRKEMTSIDKFNRTILVLASLVLPGVGILIGIYYTLKPERKNDYLGPLCLILGVVWVAVVQLTFRFL